MNEYYVGLEDIIATNDHSWTVENGVYYTEAAEVIDWFKAFTAPCYLGFDNDKAANYISLAKASVSVVDGDLVLRLHAPLNTGALTNGDVFSEAVILHEHNYVTKSDVDNHWAECSLCGDLTEKEVHVGGIPSSSKQAVCEVCGQAYGDLADFVLTLDGNTDDWSSEQKANALKGWHEDSEGRIRGLEYMAFVDAKYVYIYSKTITASNTTKSLDIVFADDRTRPYAHVSSKTISNTVVYSYFSENNLLENGLYETVSEVVLDKSAFVNSNSNIYLSIWFNGCDDSFEPLSWHEESATTAWVLNHRSPWYQDMSHQKVTEKGFEHYHDLMQGNTCGWCQEVIDLSVAVDGNSSDWSETVLTSGVTSSSPNNVFTTAFMDDEFVYIYLEVTALQATAPNYMSIYSKYSANFNGIRANERFNLTWDDGYTNLRPYCSGKKACAYNYCDCNNGFAKMALTTKTNESGQTVACFELVIDRQLFVNQNPADANYELCRYEIQIGPKLTTNQNVTNWGMMIAATDGLHKAHNYVTKYDENYHWTECTCGRSTAKVAHSGGLATPTQKAVCSGCGQEYGEYAIHEHSFVETFDATHHWTECSCGEVTDKVAHFGGTPTSTQKAVCEACGQEYGEFADFVLVLDGNTNDWSEAQKANALKGWYEDSEGKTRGLEYMAFVDGKYVYIYTRTITTTDATKILNIYFNKNGSVLNTSLSADLAGSNIAYYYFAENTFLGNGLYETVSEIVIDKSAYVNKYGNVYLGIMFEGCDDSFSPLSWHKEGLASNWVLNHKNPSFTYMSHQKVTENGFDHYHAIAENEGNVCGWCQQEIKLDVTIDADPSDWSEDILATTYYNTTKTDYHYSGTCYIKDGLVYFYVEVTQLTATDNFTGFRLFTKGTVSKDGIRPNTPTDNNASSFYLCHTAGKNNLRPSNSVSTDPYYSDIDNGFILYAMTRKTNDEGKQVICYEFVIDSKVIIGTDSSFTASYNKVRFGMQFNTGVMLKDWSDFATENGFSDV